MTGKRTLTAVAVLLAVTAGVAAAQQRMGPMHGGAGAIMGDGGPMMGGGMMGGGMMGTGPMMHGGGPMMGGPMMGGPGMMGQMGDWAGYDPVEGRIAFLRAELGITDAQQPAFDKLAATMRDESAAMQEQREAMMAREKPMTWPERLTWQATMLSERLAALKQKQAAVDALYPELSDAQKQLVDGMGHGPR